MRVGREARGRGRLSGQALKSPHIVGLFCPSSRSLLTLVRSAGENGGGCRSGKGGAGGKAVGVSGGIEVLRVYSFLRIYYFTGRRSCLGVWWD